jgi:hypothetical protein
LPQNEKHKKYTKQRLGITGWDTHRWMDEPWRIFGLDHRMFRHEPWVWLPYFFINKYNKRLARLIVWTHLELDFDIKLL